MIAGLPSNIFLLFTAAPLLLCVSPVMIFAGTLLAKETAPTPELAALPVTVMIVTAALSMGPVVRIYQQLGRRKGTWVGVLCTVAGTSICFVAARQGWFAALVAGGFFYGVSQAFLHQYRFIGFESLANPEDFPKAFAVLMMSGVVSAWLGPEIAWQGKDLLEAPFGYAGSFLILLFLHLVAFVVLYRLQDPPVENTTAATGGRPLSQIVFQVPWLLSFLAAAIGFGVMASMMTSTPITMNSGGSFTLKETKWVMQTHIIAMFLPSPAVPWLITRIGVQGLMFAGSIILIMAPLLALTGQEFVHYFWSLLLLGVGWNFLFQSGTTLLTTCYRPEERFRVQAVYDTGVIFVQALATLTSVPILLRLGWGGISWFSLPFALFMLLAAGAFLVFGRERPPPAPTPNQL